MGLYKTERCFFTELPVINNSESNGEWLDGFYYTILYNNKIREIRLLGSYEWSKDVWVDKHGVSLFKLIEKYNYWHIFYNAQDIYELKICYMELSSR
jgi:hypothetical protein